LGAGEAHAGRRLEGYVAGRRFRASTADPLVATKLVWNYFKSTNNDDFDR
jgi:hypothetical protein